MKLDLSSSPVADLHSQILTPPLIFHFYEVFGESVQIIGWQPCLWGWCSQPQGNPGPASGLTSYKIFFIMLVIWHM